MNRSIVLILLLFFLNHCSFNESSRIWNNKEKETKNQANLKKIFCYAKKVNKKKNKINEESKGYYERHQPEKDEFES